MGRNELRALGTRLTAEAQAIRAAFPNTHAMRELPISAVRIESFGDDNGAYVFWVALNHLRGAMVAVCNGKADSLDVLNDELARVEQFMSYL